MVASAHLQPPSPPSYLDSIEIFSRLCAGSQNRSPIGFALEANGSGGQWLRARLFRGGSLPDVRAGLFSGAEMMRSGQSHKRGVSIFLLSVSLLTACDDSPDQDEKSLAPPIIEAAPVALPTTETTALAALPPPVPVPDHNYDEKRGWTYYYVAAISDEDRKRGRAVGSVSAFQYLGQNGDGEHILASLRSDGTVSYRAKCAKSCRIIDTDYGEKLAYSPSSIIGAAFDDAFRSRLRIAEWAKDETAGSETVTPIETPPVRTSPANVDDYPTPLASDASEPVTTEPSPVNGSEIVLN